MSCDTAIEWWTDLTTAGREGMVVKPLDFISKGRRGIAQPAIKCRGPEYLRIIYGPEYQLPGNLELLKSRAVGAKRSLAGREFALGVEALERFIRKEPLRRTHECVFGVLALESEPIDPRLWDVIAQHLSEITDVLQRFEASQKAREQSCGILSVLLQGTFHPSHRKHE